MIDNVTTEATKVATPQKIFVLDTNIILDNPSNIFQIGQKSNLIVIPGTVLDELDSFKSGHDELSYNAREFSRILDAGELLGISTEVVDHKELTIVKIFINHGNDTEIHIVSKDKFSFTQRDTDLSVINDRKILEIAKDITLLYPANEVKFLSLDTFCRLRALTLKLKTETLKPIKELELVFHKSIDLEENFDITQLNGTDIKSIFPEWTQNIFSVTLTHNNKYYYCNVQNEKIFQIDEEELKKQTIKPKTKEQIFYSRAILDSFYSIVVVDALAGSGKTLVALSGAMKLVRQKEYSKIIYIRNSVESLDKNEEVGFLSGNEEKFKIYNHPLYDSLDYIVRKELEHSNSNKSNAKKQEISEQTVSEKIEEFTERYGIETMWVGEMRGRTISNAVVIVDEVQNMSAKTLQLVLTRLDQSCKVIVIGSNLQIDNSYLNKYTNGLSTILASCFEQHPELNLFACNLTKALRGPITEFAERIFSKKN